MAHRYLAKMSLEELEDQLLPILDELLSRQTYDEVRSTILEWTEKAISDHIQENDF